MKLEDIEGDIERGDIRGMEDAFRALIGWPGEDSIDGSTPDHRRDLLARLCEKLEDDGNQMPGDIRDLIQERCEDLEGGTYGDGARAVRESPQAFRARLDR